MCWAYWYTFYPGQIGVPREIQTRQKSEKIRENEGTKKNREKLTE